MSDEIVEILESPSDAILSSTLTPASEGGRSSHSHCLDMIEAHSFVSAWDLYQERIRRALTVIGSSEDRGEVPEPCVCACVCVCASPVEDEPQTASSMIVPVESSQ
jgi:hypothetical protein